MTMEYSSAHDDFIIDYGSLYWDTVAEEWGCTACGQQFDSFLDVIEHQRVSHRRH
jgi:hypothetical protein